jgi:hyperosmotically inducible protein
MLGWLVRTVLTIVLVVAVVVGVGAFLLGYGVGGHRTTPAVGTSGRGIDTQVARERGAEVGEKLAVMANQAQDAISDGSITAKIKSKMALDDTIKSRDIHVSTSQGAVTLSGKVASAAERDRALQLSRETEGVKSVTDHLQVGGK